jgi:hypothetical protein
VIVDDKPISVPASSAALSALGLATAKPLDNALSVLGAQAQSAFPLAQLTKQIQSIAQTNVRGAIEGAGVATAGLAASRLAEHRAFGFEQRVLAAQRRTLDSQHRVRESGRRMLQVESRLAGVAKSVGPQASAIGLTPRLKLSLSMLAQIHGPRIDVARIIENAIRVKIPTFAFPEPKLSPSVLGLVQGPQLDVSRIVQSAIRTITTSPPSLALNIELATLPRIPFPSTLTDGVERARRRFDAIDRFARRWENHALWFILSSLSIGIELAFGHRDREEVEAAVLDGLEAIVASGAFTGALITAVEDADYLSPDQRQDLIHGLSHAGRGEFVLAVPSLMAGLEGALWSVARARSVINEKRMLEVRPGKVVHRIEPVVRKLPAEKSYATFVCGRVFGDIGNPVRHGEQSASRRTQALFAIVAIAGWLDAFAGVSARQVLGEMLWDQLR